jgi:hypothetical protein
MDTIYDKRSLELLQKQTNKKYSLLEES